MNISNDIDAGYDLKKKYATFRVFTLLSVGRQGLSQFIQFPGVLLAGSVQVPAECLEVLQSLHILRVLLVDLE
jgi:hypothetical protein